MKQKFGNAALKSSYPRMSTRPCWRNKLRRGCNLRFCQRRECGELKGKTWGMLRDKPRNVNPQILSHRGVLPCLNTFSKNRIGARIEEALAEG
jgi:hypothetical protein